MTAPVLTPSILVVGTTHRDADLAELLGAERLAAMERLLSARAAAWAGEVAPGRVRFAGGPDGAQRIAGATQALFEDYGGPVLVAWPDLPAWQSDHATAALGDLRDGCDVSLGPVFDGGFYLLAMARPVPELFELPRDAWHAPDALGVALGAASQAGLEAGMLRAERGLRHAADVRAALADPLLDDELRALLAG